MNQAAGRTQGYYRAPSGVKFETKNIKNLGVLSLIINKIRIT